MLRNDYRQIHNNLENFSCSLNEYLYGTQLCDENYGRYQPGSSTQIQTAFQELPILGEAESSNHYANRCKITTVTKSLEAQL